MLIGLAGLKQSGKTTAGDYLDYKYGFAHTSFAAPMRRFAMDVLCMNEVQLECGKEQPVAFLGNEVTPRKFLQLLGTEFGRDMIHPDLWVRACLMRVNLTPSSPTCASITKPKRSGRWVGRSCGSSARIRSRAETRTPARAASTRL